MTKGFKKVATSIMNQRWSIGVMGVLLTLSACTKADYLDVDASERPPLSAKISFVNAMPENKSLVFWTYTTRVTPTSVPMNVATPYLNAQFGLVQINITTDGSSSYLASKVFGGSPTFTSSGGPNGPIPDYFHTVFAAKAKANNYTTDSLLLFYDDLSAPAAGKAKLRFVNLAPGADSVEVLFDGQPVFSKVKYGAAGGAVLSGADLNVFSIGPYVSINAKSADLEIKKTGDGLPMLIKGNLFESLNLVEGKIYTAFISGESSSGLNLSLLQHN